MEPGKKSSFCGDPLIGQRLQSVEKQNYTWFFGFSMGVSLATESPWRLIEGNRIVAGSEDHDQQFGLPAPMNAANEVLSRIQGRTVDAAFVAADTGDLTIRFSAMILLQLLQLSSGYESWRFYADGEESICMGGGSIARVPRS